jgi:hypothetical protein
VTVTPRRLKTKRKKHFARCSKTRPCNGVVIIFIFAITMTTSMANLQTVARCAQCGEGGNGGEGGAGLKTCKSCKHIKYCSVMCQRLNWPSHKKECKRRAAQLHDESLFKQPPPKDDCPICFLPMPSADMGLTDFYHCCGKTVCNGCGYNSSISGSRKCPFCNANVGMEDEIILEQMMKRVEANDADSMTELGKSYAYGRIGLQQDWNKAFGLWTRAAELGSSTAHYSLGGVYYEGMGKEKDMMKAIHHSELAAMAGHDLARFQLGWIEFKSGNTERAIKHWTISASAGHSQSMTDIKQSFERVDGGFHAPEGVENDVYELTLKAYNDACAEMWSKAREDAATKMW